MTSPSKLKQSYTVSEEEEDSILSTPTKPGSTYNNTSPMRAQTEPPPSPSTRRLPSVPKAQTPLPTREPQRNVSFGGNGALARLPTQLLHNLRESFSVLDSDSTGSVDAASVAETFRSLGLQESNLSQFFPPGHAQQLSLPQYLNQLADLLVGLSAPQELMNAFSAFDDDDNGQIDVAEMRRAIIATPHDAGERQLTERDIDAAMSGFTGRRTLGKGATGISGVRSVNSMVTKGSGGDVFRYREFVGNLTGGPAMHNEQAVPAR